MYNLTDKGKQDLLMFIIFVIVISVATAFISIFISIGIVLLAAGFLAWLKHYIQKTIKHFDEMEQIVLRNASKNNEQVIYLTDDEMDDLITYGATIHNNKHITSQNLEIYK